ncbi:MAG: prepilin-type N-terminal cleavage/methylation domain-containing protein [Sedimentisphaerales bacterium]|nr:prepilin-type N-terminal cleavage/methylation domain-containing protein [Sedimentisphaerales bacterium]
MRNKGKNKAFTIIELLVAMALLTALLLVSGMVFKMAVDAHRRASATTEIMRKLRAITDQLDNDFAGLRKDGEILIAWRAQAVDLDGDPVPASDPVDNIARYERYDVVMFFADGNFQTYNKWPLATGDIVHGNLARLTYMLGWNTAGQRPVEFEPGQRILARSQHIVASDPGLVYDINGDPYPLDPTDVPAGFTIAHCNADEYENLTMLQWRNLPWADKGKIIARVIGEDIDTDGDGTPNHSPPVGWTGLAVDTRTPANVHLLLAQGVGQFSVQAWVKEQARWYPEVDLNQDGTIDGITDTDFLISGDRIDGTKAIGRYWNPDYGDFEQVTGLGRALKFTFTLYDSKGVFTNGKTFTHIVRLGD